MYTKFRSNYKLLPTFTKNIVSLGTYGLRGSQGQDLYTLVVTYSQLIITTSYCKH